MKQSKIKHLKSFESLDRILIDIDDVLHACICLVAEDEIKFIPIDSTDKIGNWCGEAVDESKLDYKIIHHYRPYKEQ
jgi:hypothetical protein